MDSLSWRQKIFGYYGRYYGTVYTVPRRGNHQLILDEMAVIIRRLANLKSTWSYKWNTKANCVEKVKMHYDQSKIIFKEENMEELTKLVKLAIVESAQAHWVEFLAQYIQLFS